MKRFAVILAFGLALCIVLCGCPAPPESTEPPATSEPALPDAEATMPPEEKTAPKIENGQYVYNPYCLSGEAEELMGEDFAAFYADFIDAYLSYRTACSCPNEDFADMLSTVLFYEFPLFSADLEINSVSGYRDGQLNWSYTSSREEHARIINEFTDTVNGFLRDVKSSQSEQVRAETIYHAFCPEMTYDYEVLQTRVNVDPYYAYVNKRGVCVTFALAYSQLLTQVGIKSTTATGSCSDGQAHVWNVVTLQGTQYFCDPTFELNYLQGKAFAYFGMSMADRTSDGTKVDYIGRFKSIPIADADISQSTLPFIPLED